MITSDLLFAILCDGTDVPDNIKVNVLNTVGDQNQMVLSTCRH